MEKSVVRAPSTLELIKIDGQLALRYDDIIGILIASEAFKFIEVLKSTEETDFDEPHMVQFSNGSLAIRIYEAHINFEFEIRQPRFSNLSTSIDRGPIQANLEEFERVVRSFFS